MTPDPHVPSDPSERWALICSLYKSTRERGGDEAFRVGRLAIHLRKELVKALGCPEDSVTHIQWVNGSAPIYDKSDQVKSGWDSVLQAETGWTFGLGVLLEVSPTTYPKTTVRFPIEVAIHDHSFDVRSSLFTGEITVDAATELYSDALTALAEAICAGLIEVLRRNDEPQRVGFTTVASNGG